MIRTRIAAPAAIAALTALALSFNPLPTEATSSKASASSQAAGAYETAIFAGGCFWCVESDFDHVNGVVKTTSGYMGGNSENATYKTIHNLAIVKLSPLSLTRKSPASRRFSTSSFTQPTQRTLADNSVTEALATQQLSML